MLIGINSVPLALGASDGTFSHTLGAGSSCAGSCHSRTPSISHQGGIPRGSVLRTVPAGGKRCRHWSGASSSHRHSIRRAAPARLHCRSLSTPCRGHLPSAIASSSGVPTRNVRLSFSRRKQPSTHSMAISDRVRSGIFLPLGLRVLHICQILLTRNRRLRVKDRNRALIPPPGWTLPAVDVG